LLCSSRCCLWLIYELGVMLFTGPSAHPMALKSEQSTFCLSFVLSLFLSLSFFLSFFLSLFLSRSFSLALSLSLFLSLSFSLPSLSAVHFPLCCFYFCFSLIFLFVFFTLALSMPLLLPH